MSLRTRSRYLGLDDHVGKSLVSTWILWKQNRNHNHDVIEMRIEDVDRI